MMDFAAFQFAHPALLLLLAPLWLLLGLLARFDRRHSMWDRVCDPHLLENMRTSGRGSDWKRWLIWPLGLVLTLGVLAIAGPGWRAQPQAEMQSANARIIALELSQTMRVQDIKPDRFTQAVTAAREIISADFDGETGLVVYAGAAFVVSPLSRDANTLLAFVDAFEPGLLPVEGARLDLAIERAQDLLLASISGRGQIIIIGAGNENRAQAVQAAASARGRGHEIFILAAGTASGAPLIDSDGAMKRDGNGRFIMARTDFDALASIAQAGGGRMLDLSTSGAYDALLAARINANVLLEAGKAKGSEGRAIANEGYWLVWLALPFALLLFRRNLFGLVFVAVLLPQSDITLAAEVDSVWRHREYQAYIAYRQGSFERSAELAETALLRGAAYYRAGNYHRALEAFSLEDSALAHFNRGNTLVQLDRTADAIGAYEKALELDPELIDARYNRRLLELFQQQQQQPDGQLGADTENDTGQLETPEQNDNLGRSGVIGEQLPNPGDQQRLQSGFGAATQLGQLDPFEQFDGREQQLDRFSLSDGITRMQADIFVENWVSKLPAASSDLFRRKFLRDYQRQQQAR